MSNEEQDLSTNVETPKTTEKGRVLFQAKAKEPGQSVTLSLSELKELLGHTSQVSQDQTAKLVEAILESRKPYTDPNAERIKRNVRKKMREQLLKEDRNIDLEQERCVHMQGLHGRIPGQLTAIAKHLLDTGEMIGICLACLRIFRSHDADYMYWLQRPSGCELSQAGRRTLVNPSEAIKISQEGYKVHDDRGRVVKAVAAAA